MLFSPQLSQGELHSLIWHLDRMTRKAGSATFFGQCTCTQTLQHVGLMVIRLLTGIQERVFWKSLYCFIWNMNNIWRFAIVVSCWVTSDSLAVPWTAEIIPNIWRMLLIPKCMLSRFSRVWLFATSLTVAHQTSLSIGFSKQEYWSGLPFPSLVGLPQYQREKPKETKR